MNLERFVSSILNKQVKRRDLLETGIIGGSAIVFLALSQYNRSSRVDDAPTDTFDILASPIPITVAPLEDDLDPATFIQEFDAIVDEFMTNSDRNTSKSGDIDVEILSLVSDRGNPISLVRYLYDDKSGANSLQYRSISIGSSHYEQTDNNQMNVNYIQRKKMTTYKFLDNAAPEKLTIMYTEEAKNKFQRLENYKGPEPVSQLELRQVLSLLQSATTDNQRMPLDLGSSNEPRRL